MESLVELAARVGELLKERGWTVGTAESCTGGLVAHAITNISGSSAYFIGAIVAYANQAKMDLLNVPAALLVKHGAVSQEVALAMARGVRRALRTDIGVATTGIAGPTGGTPQKPVGSVYIALSSPLGERVGHHVWDRDRLGNKCRTARAALALLAEQLSMSK